MIRMMRKQYALPRLDDAIPSAGLDEHPANDEKPGSSSETRLSAFTIQVIAMASLGGILFGYDLGVVSGALPWLTLDFDLSVRQQEMVVSILYVGGGVGAMVGGSICDTFGRKRAIIVTDICFLIGAFILWLAPSYAYVILGRLVVGFAVAVSGIADVSYLHEIAPVQLRGSIVSVNEACISLGFLLAFVASIAFSSDTSASAWRPMFGASGLIAILQLLGMARMPESPLWLQGQGRIEESRVAMQLIRGRALIPETVEGDEKKTEERYSSLVEGDNDVLLAIASHPARQRQCYFNLVSTHFHGVIILMQQQIVFVKQLCINHRRQAIIACFLAVTQQFCGQTNVLSYAPAIFAAAGRNAQSTDAHSWATLSIGLVKFITTVLVVWKIEVFGRRFLLLSGIAVIAVGMLFLVIAFESMQLQGLSTGNAENLSENGVGLAWAIPGVLLVVTGYSLSFGTLTWLLTSELFPTEIRGRALGASTIVTYACATLVTSTFISAQVWLGRPSSVFLIYFLVACAGFLFALVAIPDTKGKDISDIEISLDNMPWWKLRRPVSIDGDSVHIGSSPPHGGDIALTWDNQLS
ncbi:hypothetical protein MPSEU_000140300 [Mayamaea pseudoterrestris]|nr:hypothetical protein MPSEU_000140300 [Mayamaea pseudoterrestris]